MKGRDFELDGVAVGLAVLPGGGPYGCLWATGSS